LHPFTPFITEDLHSSLQREKETVMLSDWPVFDASLHDPAAEKDIERVKEAVRAIRNVRTEKQVPPSRKITVLVQAAADAVHTFEQCRGYMGFLCGASTVKVLSPDAQPHGQAISVVVSGAVLYLPLADLVDAAKERERLTRERERILKEITRVDNKLGNEGFIAKAPADVIKAEREKREDFLLMLSKIDEQLGAGHDKD
jgi:valyl-tRNA synthetase